MFGIVTQFLAIICFVAVVQEQIFKYYDLFDTDSNHNVIVESNRKFHRQVYWTLLLTSGVYASEFPERECCDPVYPPPVPTAPSSSAATPTGRSGPNIKTAIAILNCLLARQLCFEDVSCSAILEIIPRVCGPELVACSTVTVTKCQAALRTLQAFPFFKPTCLCREPHVDPECNSFRDFLFDHPCVFVMKKEKDPYPVDALPTCNHALSVCQREEKCIKLFEDFKTNCKVRDNKCRMEDRELCHESWTNLRLSPMFGCICPNNHMKRRCDRIFGIVNHNPCVVKVISPSKNASAGITYDVDFQTQLKSPLIDYSGSMGHEHLRHIDDPRDILGIDRGGFSHHHNYTTGEEIVQHHHRHSSPTDLTKFAYKSTCHIALENCNNDYMCRAALQPVLHYCDMANCHRNSCMEALQNLYHKPELSWSLEIAFCLCKNSENKQDACLVAQEKLHPICAQRVEGSPIMPACHSLAEECKKDKDCKVRLEFYEQSCAVDITTTKCAGPPSKCRIAMLGILGTELRTLCGCKGTDIKQTYLCLGWQRLLWVNPCVVQSQNDFHIKNAAIELAKLSTTSSTTTTTVAQTVRTPWRGDIIQQRSSTILTLSTPVTTTTVTTETTEPPTTTELTTKPIPTTMPTTTSTVPQKYCKVQKPHQNIQYIRDGKSKRLYRDDEYECSDLCQCAGETLTCHTICVDRIPCKTEFAFYNHASPAYQAFRGRCLCYSGQFICMRPTPDEYNISDGGVYLFLGYSETDEALLKPHSNLTIQDVAASLQEFMAQEMDNKTACQLSIFNVTKANVILVAKLHDENDETDESKEKCASILKNISEKINNRHPEFKSHLLLSIFKMADVEVVKTSTNSNQKQTKHNPFLISITILLLFVNQMQQKSNQFI